MADLGNLIVKIEADVSALKKGLLDAQNHTKQFSDQASKNINFIGDVFKLVFAERVVSYMTSAFMETVRYGDELNRLANLANVSAGQIAKLQFAFEQEGASVETLNRLIPVLSKNIREAATGTGEMYETFRKLGIDVRDSTGNLKNTAAVFGELAQKIGQMEDKTEALAITMQVLGKGGKDAFQILSKGGENLKSLFDEFDSFGVGEEKLNDFAKASEELNDSFDKLKTRFMLFKVALATELYPILEKVVDKLIQFDWNKFAEDIALTAGAFIKAAEALKPYLDYIERFLAAYQKIGTFVQGYAGGGMTALGAGLGGGIGGLGAMGGPGALMAGMGAGAIGGGAGAVSMMDETVVTAPRAGGEGGGEAGGAGGGEGGGKVTGIAGMLKAIRELPAALKASVKQMDKPLKDMDGIFTKLGKGIESTFQQAFASMMAGGESFSKVLADGFKNVAIEFISMIATMILKWTAFFMAVMAIALVLQAFGVPIGSTFKAAFAFVSGGGTADAKTATGGIKASAGNIFKGFLGMRSGGALMARNGLMTAQTGMAVTGGLGEGGIPVMAHPNEIIAPIDKVFEFMQKGSLGGGITVNVMGGGQDPRQLAEAIMIEIERKRRNP